MEIFRVQEELEFVDEIGEIKIYKVVEHEECVLENPIEVPF